MNARLAATARASCTRCTQLLARLWREPDIVPCQARSGLEIALEHSPRAWRAGWLLLVLQVCHALELAASGQWPLAAAALGLAGWFGVSCRAARRGTPGSARRLLLAADGRLHVLTVAGSVEQVRLDPASMRLGPWLLLLLRAERCDFRLLLGPDNLQAGQLAALRRRLGAVSVSAAASG